MKLWSIHGNSQRLDGGAMFGSVPKALWTRWVEVDEKNRIELSCRALLVEDEGRRILFETGIGAFFEPKLRDRFGVVEPEHMLLKNLATLGLSHESIDIVVLSHLHFDHAGGLLTPWNVNFDSELLFPNATFIVGEKAWQRACKPHTRDRASFIPLLQELLENSGRLERVTGNSSPILGPKFRFHLSDGHTPGLLLTEITTDDGPLVFAGDLIPGVPWVHLPITMGYDRFPERLIDEKRTLLEDLVARNGRLFFTHDPRTAVGTVTFNGRKFSIASPQSELQP